MIAVDDRNKQHACVLVPIQQHLTTVCHTLVHAGGTAVLEQFW